MTTSFGRYLLHKKLAHGGMAEIFLAWPEDAKDHDPPVVIKRILPELAKDFRFVSMFLNEAQLAATMSHPNIVHVLEFGECHEQLFMAMEFVDGLDCWRFSKHTDELGIDHIPVALFIIHNVLNALEYAHGITDVNGLPMNVVHRDLSPSNIYLSKRGEVKLGDFGIARIDSERYRPIEIIPKGKFGYMAPEQVEGKTIDARADIYSTGVVLAEFLIGQQLFTGSSQLSVARDIRDGRLDTLEANAERIPVGIHHVLENALARDPDDRFRSAREFSEALMAYQSSAGHNITHPEFAAHVTHILKTCDSITSGTSPLDEIAQTLSGKEILGMQSTTGEGITARDLISTGTNESGTPITMDFEQKTGEGKYWARPDSESTIGPTSFAHIIELIYSDRIGADTPISKNGIEFQEAQEFVELVRHLPVGTPTAEHQELASPNRKGFLELTPTTCLLLALSYREDTGLLICEQNRRRKEVYLKSGVVVYVGTNDAGELLGEYLVANDVITRMELEMALALLPKFHGHLGDTLIALGIMTAVDLFRHISNQISKRLKDLLDWKWGVYEFFEQVEVRKGVLEVQLGTASFIQDALLEGAAAADGTTIFQNMESYSVAPTANASRIMERLRLPERYRQPLLAINDWCPISRLPFHDSQQPGETGKILFVGIESGIWSCDADTIFWRSPPAASRIENNGELTTTAESP